MRAKIVCALTVLACLGSLAAGAQQGKFKFTVMFRSGKTVTGQELQFPTGKVEIVSGTAEFEPGAETPVHKHPYPRSLYILEGTLTVTEEGGEPHTFRAGSFVVEAVDVWHTGRNTTASPVKILVIDEVPAGFNNSIPKPK